MTANKLSFDCRSRGSEPLVSAKLQPAPPPYCLLRCEGILGHFSFFFFFFLPTWAVVVYLISHLTKSWGAVRNREVAPDLWLNKQLTQLGQQCLRLGTGRSQDVTQLVTVFLLWIPQGLPYSGNAKSSSGNLRWNKATCIQSRALLQLQGLKDCNDFSPGPSGSILSPNGFLIKDNLLYIGWKEERIWNSLTIAYVKKTIISVKVLRVYLEF
jgi:hypothetical protein